MRGFEENSPEPRSEVVEMGPRPPPEEAPAEAEADGDASERLASPPCPTVLGAKTTGESEAQLIPRKS